MHGLIGKMSAVVGKRDELVAILVESVGAMPGCLSYIVAKDNTDEQAIHITELCNSKSNHYASLSLPSVKASIARGSPSLPPSSPAPSRRRSAATVCLPPAGPAERNVARDRRRHDSGAAASGPRTVPLISSQSSSSSTT